MGKGVPVMPGVPAAGHLSPGGFWHPGKAEGCPKCEAVRQMVERTCAEQGVPVKVSDPLTIRRVATLLGGPRVQA